MDADSRTSEDERRCRMTRIRALQIALDAMCNFHAGYLNEEEMEAIDVITNMLVKMQLQARKRKRERR